MFEKYELVAPPTGELVKIEKALLTLQEHPGQAIRFKLGKEETILPGTHGKIHHCAKRLHMEIKTKTIDGYFYIWINGDR